MRSVSITVTRNESDVIEEMIRHNCQFLDAIYIADMSSSDGTKEIILSLQDEGLPVKLFAENCFGKSAKEIINQAITDLNIHKDAYIFFLDGDEFIRSDKNAFTSFLDRLPSSFMMQWCTYTPTVYDDQKSSMVTKRITHRRVKDPSGSHFWKSVVSPMARYDVTLSKGNHRFVEYAPYRQSTIGLAHFPVRNSDQLTAKAIIGSWSVSLLGRQGREAFQWYDIADFIRKHGMPSLSDLQKISKEYASRMDFEICNDPLISPYFFETKYSHHQRQSALLSIIDYTDSIIAGMVGRAMAHN